MWLFSNPLLFCMQWSMSRIRHANQDEKMVEALTFADTKWRVETTTSVMEMQEPRVLSIIDLWVILISKSPKSYWLYDFLTSTLPFYGSQVLKEKRKRQFWQHEIRNQTTSWILLGACTVFQYFIWSRLKHWVLMVGEPIWRTSESHNVCALE